MSDYSEYRYLIVGGGMVADSAARGIREIDPEGPIGIVAEEETPPVARPALSKKLWTDSSFSFDDAWLDTEADTGATRHAGERAVEIDREVRTVRTEHGVRLRYEQLLLATGGTPKTLDLPDDERIVYFRSIDDYQRLRALSGGDRQIVVIGGSFIGTELAAALVQNDTEATLIFPESVLGGGVFPAALARRFQEMYEREGVGTVPDATVVSAGIGGDGGIRLALSTGEAIDCDAVVAGVGVTPNIGLARAAGLETDDGVLVDERLRTSDPHILAAGDIASYPDAILGRRRIERVDNAIEMGRQAGRNLAGADEPYDHTPYFYSVVFGNRYEAVGVLDSSLETVELWHEDSGVVYYVDGDLLAPVRVARTFLDDLRVSGRGRLVFLASEDAVQPYDDELPYCAAKAGVLALAKGLSRSYAEEGLRVNAVSPAFIHTPMTDAMIDQRAAELETSRGEAISTFLDEERPFLELKRRGAPEEVAVVAFLCSDRASFVNGANYRVDGTSASPWRQSRSAPIVSDMNAIEILIDLARRPREAAEMLRDSLTPERLNAHPHHDNSIAWLLWHAARELDAQLATLSGQETVWISDGFADRFGLDLEPHEMGYGHTSERARSVVVDDPDLLLDHLGAVVDAQLAYLESLRESELSEIVDEQWEPPVTRASRLVSISVDAAEHVAQAAYVAGMGAGAFERGARR